MKTRRNVTLFLLAAALFSCKEKIEKAETNSKQNSATCESYWANSATSLEVKQSLLEKILDQEKGIPEENKKFLTSLIHEIGRNPADDKPVLTVDKPIYPIYRLREEQVGVLGFMQHNQFNGTWEEYAREHTLLKENFAYQSIDSVGKLVSFPDEFSGLYNDNPPQFYWYSVSKKAKSRFTGLAYFGNDCLSYYQYDFSIPKVDLNEHFLFGSPYGLELEFKNYPEIDKLFKTQYAENCEDCLGNYPDQKTFAKMKGTKNLYFAYADVFPINNKLAAPSRSLVLLTPKGQLITLWSIELDLIGCGCN